jgi:hypothetical protein
MELFIELFGKLLVFVYHCFDRIVINGYLSGLSRPEQVVYFFRRVCGVGAVTKEVLSERTASYQHWVETYAREHAIAIEWAESGVRKEDYVRPWLRKIERRKAHGVFFIFKSMEQGSTFRSAKPKYPAQDLDYRILSKQRSRFTHYYFYIRDEVLGAFVMRVASFFPFQATYYLNGHNFMEKELNRLGISYRKDDNAFLSVSDQAELQAAADRFGPEIIRARLEHWTSLLGPKFSDHERTAINLKRFYAVSQVEYCRNFIFKRHFPIHRIFERSCEIGLWLMTTDKISQIFGVRITRKLQGKLQTTIEKIEHGHHIFRAYCKNAFVKQYEKFSTFLRNEVCANNLADFKLKKGLDHLTAARNTLLAITERFAGFQAQALNVHFDFPLFQRLALPVMCGTIKIPGIKLHDTRMLRLMEIMMHAGTTISGWSASRIHEVVLTTYGIAAEKYRLPQVRYDLRKLKAHGLLERDGRHYTYRLTEKGIKVSVMFLLFHKLVCGPIANSLFHHRSAPEHKIKTKLESAYDKADDSIKQLIDFLEAA